MSDLTYKVIDQTKDFCIHEEDPDNCETCFCGDDLSSCDSCGDKYRRIIISFTFAFHLKKHFNICEKCIDTSNYIIKKQKEVLGGQGLNE